MQHARALAALLLVALLLSPVLATASPPEPKGKRFIFSSGSPPALTGLVRHEAPWWLTTSLDADRNGLSDALERLAADGRPHPAIVSYGRAVGETDIRSIESLGVEVAGVYPMINSVSLAPARPELLAAIRSLDGVVFLQERGIPVLYSDIANPAVKAKQSAEFSPRTAWDMNYTGRGVNIAIMDTGVDNNHPSLKGKWLGGVDFTRPDTRFTPRDGTYDADDQQGHGTTVSGIAMGTGEPEKKYQGPATSAMLVDVRIGTRTGYGWGEIPYAQDFYDTALLASQWVFDHRGDKWRNAPPDNTGIDILSLSWGIYPEGEANSGGTDGSDIYSEALNKIVDGGVIVVVAAGNEGPDNVGLWGMGSADKVITIGATDDKNTVPRDDDIIAGYSSRGPRKDDGDGYPYDELKPDVSAPGTNIMQAQFDKRGDGSGNGYGSRGSGTSYATPLVAGIVALLLDANANLTGNTIVVKEILRATAERRGEPTVPELDPFWNREFGWGMADAYRAVRVAKAMVPVELTDTELQCFVMNATVKGGKVAVSGIDWARAGSVEGVEVRVDSAPWTKVKPKGGNWSAELSIAGLRAGNHTIEARAYGNGTYSLPSIEEFNVTRAVSVHVTVRMDLTAPGLLLLAVAVAVVYLVVKKGLFRQGR